MTVVPVGMAFVNILQTDNMDVSSLGRDNGECVSAVNVYFLNQATGKKMWFNSY